MMVVLNFSSSCFAAIDDEGNVFSSYLPVMF